jgi:16S rRNA processing protein RimM
LKPDQFITVGKLGRARGIEGEIYVTPTTDFPDRFVGLTEIFIDDRGTWKVQKIESSRMIGSRPVLKFLGVNSPEEAARMTNRKLAVARQDLVELPEGTYYIFDLIGCNVFTDDPERLVGTITDVRQYPANDVYVIKTENGSEILFPAVKDFISDVDPSGKRIVVDPAGLIKQD